MKVLITGSSGFVGGPLSEALLGDGFDVVGLVRDSNSGALKSSFNVFSCDLSSGKAPIPPLSGVDAVVHLAASVHNAKCASEQHYRVNCEATLRLANCAVSAGVRRFVFVSSVKVLGEVTRPGEPFKADDTPDPVGPYAISKREAEIELMKISKHNGLEVVIIRPTLIIGPSPKGNFRMLSDLVARGVPLPLAAITQNRRSFLTLQNLIDLIRICLTHPAAANNIFLASDGEDLSTAMLLKHVGECLNRSARLFYAPPRLLQTVFLTINREDLYQRLGLSLQVDIDKTRVLLGWHPQVSTPEGIRLALAKFRK